MAGALHVMELGKDRMITAYRNHVQPIGMGVDPKQVMAELFGKSTGTSMGLGGSMHIFSKEHKFHGGHGIVGGQIPLGAGMAFEINILTETMLPSVLWVTELSDKVRYMRHSISPLYGSYLWFL